MASIRWALNGKSASGHGGEKPWIDSLARLWQISSEYSRFVSVSVDGLQHGVDVAEEGDQTILFPGIAALPPKDYRSETAVLKLFIYG